MDDNFYPHEFPCRLSGTSRIIHCDSCEIVPNLLKTIDELKTEIKVLQRRLGYSTL